jgi:hypothetical protein
VLLEQSLGDLFRASRRSNRWLKPRSKRSYASICVPGWRSSRSCAQSSKRLELAATLTSWSIYGAALEWRKQAGAQSADAFVDESLPLIAATITVLGS